MSVSLCLEINTPLILNLISVLRFSQIKKTNKQKKPTHKVQHIPEAFCTAFG